MTDHEMHIRSGQHAGYLSAGSMPELLHGECVMRRRLHIPLGEADQRTVVVWRRGVLAVLAVVAAAAISIPAAGERSSSTGLTAGQSEFASACRAWDQAAGDAISLLLRGNDDIDLRRTGDAVFRLRRARRNCHAGWVNVACKDYQAVIRMARDDATSTRQSMPSSCGSASDPSQLVEIPKD